MNHAKVALNVSKLNAPQLSSKSRIYVLGVDANPSIFTNPNPATADVTAAANVLDTAIDNAFDGGKGLTKTRNDKRRALDKLITRLGDYVDGIADGDEAIIHLAGMDVKRTAVRNVPTFKVVNGTDHGSVNITVKAVRGSTYKWQYCIDPTVANAWLEAGMTGGAKKTITNLNRGTNYWFRVILIDGNGEHVQTPESYAVN